MSSLNKRKHGFKKCLIWCRSCLHETDWISQHLKKKSLKLAIYRVYKNFALFSNHGNGYPSFEKKFVNVFKKHAPKKAKIFCGNQKPHLNKSLRAAIMKRFCLKNKTSKGVFIWGKNIPPKWEPQLNEISPYKKILLKNQNLFINEFSHLPGIPLL